MDFFFSDRQNCDGAETHTQPAKTHTHWLESYQLGCRNRAERPCIKSCIKWESSRENREVGNRQTWKQDREPAVRKIRWRKEDRQEAQKISRRDANDEEILPALLITTRFFTLDRISRNNQTFERLSSFYREKYWTESPCVSSRARLLRKLMCVCLFPCHVNC